jgi:hypothetical protein
LPQAQAIDVAQNTPPGATGPRRNEIKLADHNAGDARHVGVAVRDRLAAAVVW